jgi:hypothetical protein
MRKFGWSILAFIFGSLGNAWGQTPVNSPPTAPVAIDTETLEKFDNMRIVDGVRFTTIQSAFADLGSGTVGSVWEPLSTSSGTLLPTFAESSTGPIGSGGISGQRRWLQFCTPSTGEWTKTGETGCGWFVDNYQPIDSAPDNTFFFNAYYHPGVVIENMNTGPGHRASLLFRKPATNGSCGTGCFTNNMWFLQSDVGNNGQDEFAILMGLNAGGLGNATGFYSVFNCMPQTNALTGTGNGNDRAPGQGQCYLQGNYDVYGLMRARSQANDTSGIASFSLRTTTGKESFIHAVGSNSNGTSDISFDSARRSNSGLYRFVMDGTGSLQATSNGIAQTSFRIAGGISSAPVSSGTTGFQHKRVAGCATIATLNSTCDTTVTWTSAFADTNYTATCTGEGVISGVPIIEGHSISAAKSTTTIKVRTLAITAGAAQFATVDCTAVHD